MIVTYFTKRLVGRSTTPILRGLQPFVKPQKFQRLLHNRNGPALIDEAPSQVRLGLVKVLAVVIPFLYLGAVASKHGAEFLEEWDIFVPEDDDD